MKAYFLRDAGCKRAADEKELKSAFRKLAICSSSDRNPAIILRAQVQEINEAYETLKDPQKRAAMTVSARGL